MSKLSAEMDLMLPKNVHQAAVDIVDGDAEDHGDHVLDDHSLNGVTIDRRWVVAGVGKAHGSAGPGNSCR